MFSVLDDKIKFDFVEILLLTFKAKFSLTRKRKATADNNNKHDDMYVAAKHELHIADQEKSVNFSIPQNWRHIEIHQELEKNWLQFQHLFWSENEFKKASLVPHASLHFHFQCPYIVKVTVIIVNAK